MKRCNAEDIEKLLYEIGCCTVYPLSSYSNLYEEGAIDSVQIAEMIMRLEEIFGIEFETDELIFDNFGTIEKIQLMVNQKIETPRG